MGNKTDLTVIS